MEYPQIRLSLACLPPNAVMTQPTLLELAKQGNPKAISALLNQQLKDRGIRTRVAIKEGCLHVLLHAEHQVPDPEQMVDLVRANLLDLDADTIFRAIVYGRQTGEEKPAWSQVLVSTGEDFQLACADNTDPELASQDIQSGDLSAAKWASRSFHPWRLSLIGILSIVALGLAYFIWYSQSDRPSPPTPARGSQQLDVKTSKRSFYG